MHQEQTRPYYPNVYPSLQPAIPSGYMPYSVNTYDSQYVSPSVTVNAFPHNDKTKIFRQAQPSSQKLIESNKSEKEHLVAHQMINISPSGTSKREVYPIQQEKNQQINTVPEQAVELGTTTMEMKFGEQKSAV